jgi:hypothetical protein
MGTEEELAPEQRADQYAIEGDEGAISMEATRVEGDLMSYNVECHSFSPPSVQLDETGTISAMTEFSAPIGNTAGTYLDTVTFPAEGAHVIICFNGTTRVRQRVFAGDIEVYDPHNYQRTPAEIQQHEKVKAGKIFVTTGKLG